ncbi:AEC family transporter [Paenibacillus glycanilyticus]|uniref:AEC family transporter n=1 Tax=Paenibacillus glycanilyticus TaxID=126569 RepID=UPI00203E873C|nr:AEC family transporter [Paenibacillus glycanilyticus]MCM3629302.1 AEC family transporter [Paenibacillus glycanilyticus]
MNIFWHILWSNVLPLTLMIAVGFTMQRLFSLDIKTLSKLNFYVFSPSVIFNLLYTTDISASLIGQVLLFVVLFMTLQAIAVELTVRLRGLEGGMRGAMRNSVLFYNSANYGIPLNQLAFSANPYTLSIQIIVMVTQSLLPNTYGIYSVNAHKMSFRSTLRTILSQPIIYVIPIAFLLHGFHVQLPQSIETPITYLSNAFIGTALVTLGVQLGNMKWELNPVLLKNVLLANGLRLVGGPALAALVVWGLGFFMSIDHMMAAALIVSSAVPTSLSSVLLAVEFDNEPEFASQAVFLSTLISIITVAVVIFLLHI